MRAGGVAELHVMRAIRFLMLAQIYSFYGQPPARLSCVRAWKLDTVAVRDAVVIKFADRNLKC